MDKYGDHEKQAPTLPTSTLPWWMDGSTLAEDLKEPHFLAKGVMCFWQKCKGWLLYPLAQLDPMSCNEQLLSVLAWDRDITRFKDEPTELFRKRVKYAFVNARDAGEKAGFIRIFQRLGISLLNQKERQPGIDWDIISLELSEQTITDDLPLITELVRQYGRTCRRYEFSVNNGIDNTLAAGEFNCEWESHHAYIEIEYQVENRIVANQSLTEFNLQSETFQAVWE